MSRTEKTAAIDETRKRFDSSIAAVLIDYKGMNVAAVTGLRRAFRKAGVEYKVIKNTVIRHALKDSSYKSFVGNFEKGKAPDVHVSMRGMTGVAWCAEDPSLAAKVIKKFREDQADLAKHLKVKAGLLGGQLQDGKWVEEEMSKLPGLKETQAMVLATLQAPAQNVVAIINAPAQNLVYLLQAWIDKREKETAGA
jgi:large subunit ribosomal protein L10